MMLLTEANQRTLHTLYHMPNGMPVYRFGIRGAHTQSSNGRLLQTRLVRAFKGPDSVTWMTLTEAGKKFVEAVRS